MDSTTAPMASEDHVSVTIEMGLSLPIAPAGIVLVWRVPRQLEVELDYRDGLVDFKYDPKRVNPAVR